MTNSPLHDPESIPRFIRYGQELRDPAIAGAREFLMVSGSLSCSSSFAGNTRRYHGLLIRDGVLLISGLDDEVNGIRLSPGWWGDSFAGEGIRYTTGATIYPVRQEFALPEARVVRTLLLDCCLVVRYEVFGTAVLRIRPVMTNRKVTTLSRDPVADIREDGGDLILNGCTVSSDLTFSEDEQWYLNAYYPCEQSRGYDAWEDLISPGMFSGTVTDGTMEIRFTPGGHGSSSVCSRPATDILDYASRLCLADEGQIRAGYHWFTESWGRDTFISLPGLLLEMGRFREAEDVFRWHLAHRKGGIIVNRYPDSWNTSDATPWFFWALFQYMQKLPGSPFVATIKHEIEDIIHRYPESGVASLSGDLITVTAGSTWMDTKYTPRQGKPVEINALWILMLEMAEFLQISPPVSSSKARRAFQAFFNEKTGCLSDILDPDDPSIRSNQIIPLALGLLPFDQGRQALSVIHRDLLTPYGLRTLAPDSSGYYGKFSGDISYHNGMVWPWQTCFYVDALLAYGEEPANVQEVISPLWHYFLTDGAGMLPEHFDGEAPHNAAGAVCMASSLGELIRMRSRLRKTVMGKPADND